MIFYEWSFLTLSRDELVFLLIWDSDNVVVLAHLMFIGFVSHSPVSLHVKFKAVFGWRYQDSFVLSKIQWTGSQRNVKLQEIDMLNSKIYPTDTNEGRLTSIQQLDFVHIIPKKTSVLVLCTICAHSLHHPTLVPSQHHHHILMRTVLRSDLTSNPINEVKYHKMQFCRMWF